jgi:hypothetical protein
VTLGLFLFVINALMFWSAAGMLPGFNVTGFGAALIGSLIYSVLAIVIDSALQRLFPNQVIPPAGCGCPRSTPQSGPSRRHPCAPNPERF